MRDSDKPLRSLLRWVYDIEAPNEKKKQEESILWCLTRMAAGSIQAQVS